MARKEKILEKLRAKPNNTDEKTFKQALNIFGFILDEKRGKGSHTMYYHPEYTSIPPKTVNFTDPIRPNHVRTLIKDIEEVY